MLLDWNMNSEYIRQYTRINIMIVLEVNLVTK